MYAKGLASSMKQARQLGTHGHITVAQQKITIPSYAITREEEDLISYHLSSKLNDESHVLREIIDGRASEATFEEEGEEEGDAE